MELVNKRADFETYANNIALTLNESLNQIESFREKASEKKIVLNEGEDERTVKALAEEKVFAKVNEMIAETELKVNEILNAYEKAEQDFFELKGENITKDKELLSLNLTSEQVKQLQEKYFKADNFTMLSSFNQYAKEKGYPELLLQSNRIEHLKAYKKMIMPRYIEKAKNNPDGFKKPFLEIAEQYKPMIMKKIFQGQEL